MARDYSMDSFLAETLVYLRGLTQICTVSRDPSWLVLTLWWIKESMVLIIMGGQGDKKCLKNFTEVHQDHYIF